MEPVIVSETLKYSDGGETVINFVEQSDQSIPESPETPKEETLEVPVEDAPLGDIESGTTESSEIE